MITNHPVRQALLDLATVGIITDHGQRSWASITFKGERHTLILRFDGEHDIAKGEVFIAYLPEADLNIKGYLVADAAVAEVDHTLNTMSVKVELLLLED